MDIKKLTTTYWEQALQDIRNAKKFHKSAVYQKSAYLSVQSAMNALTSICFAYKNYQLPAYQLVELLQICCQYNTNFQEVYDNCRIMDSIHELSPFIDAKKQGNFINKNISQKLLENGVPIIRFCYNFIRKENIMPLEWKTILFCKFL